MKTINQGNAFRISVCIMDKVNTYGHLQMSISCLHIFYCYFIEMDKNANKVQYILQHDKYTSIL